MSCDSAQASVTLTSVPYGATWNGLTEGSVTSTGTWTYDPLDSVTMVFTDTSGNVGLTLSSAAGTITIDDAAAWEFTVLPVTPMALAVGTWSWVLTFTDDAGIIKKWVVGTIRITK